MFKSILIASALALMATLAHADPVKPIDRVAHCGGLWKAHKAEHGKPAKGEGREAWNKYRTECIQRLKDEAKLTQLAK
jgi:hypothetical protein